MTRHVSSPCLFVSLGDRQALQHEPLLPAEFASLKHHSLYSLQNPWVSGLCKAWIRLILSLLPSPQGWGDRVGCDVFACGG